MSNKYEKNVYLAMLSEQCNRFKEMVQFLEEMIKNRSKDLTADERNLLSIAYKNSISSTRTALRTIIAYETKEKKKDLSTFLPFIQEYRKKIEGELTQICENVLIVIDTHLLKLSADDESKVFYVKLKGDYNRYMAEYAQGDLKDKVSKGALESYKQATEIAKVLSTIHPLALGLALNFSVFYYEVMNDHETACKIASDAYEKASKELPNIDEEAEENRDAVSIINLLKENLDMWKSELEDQ